MSYHVLARKWRPRTFATMVGQQHVLRALVNALDNDRLHHAFLFTGTRGVGKTTIARILAKSLNCETGVTSTPCGTCSACQEIDEGRFVDLIEVDAASRTKVDDTRELLDNVQYAPTRGRYKVYLIDEVHMLSGHSFNALLKTLEEPPPHVKFLLATTDPQKLPLTVLSRCLQFNLKRLPPDLIAGHLAFVLGEEGVPFEQEALKLIAHGADGSMRDGLSLLDQAIAFGAGKVNEAETREMLGSIDRGRLLALAGKLAVGDAPGAIAELGALLDQAADPEQVLDDLASLLQRVALLQVVPDAAGDDDAPLMELAQRFTPEYAQLCYQFALHGRRDLPLAPEPRAGLEMVLLRMLAFRVEDGQGADSKQPVPKQKAAPAARAAATKEAAPVADAPITARDSDWFAVVSTLSVRGVALELARNCTFGGWDGDALLLELDAACGQMCTPNAEQRLRDALARHYGRELRLNITTGKPTVETPARALARHADERQAQARDSLADDPNLRALTDAFDAGFDPDAVRPID
ncbi:MAG: DNA polymerase III subunit gamma/tau [Xanthomonadaceae bacterium]|nr:DNA polymerase III subunit gamma/tau [Xanthomonadaceae bacterium]